MEVAIESSFKRVEAFMYSGKLAESPSVVEVFVNKVIEKA